MAMDGKFLGMKLKPMFLVCPRPQGEMILQEFSTAPKGCEVVGLLAMLALKDTKPKGFNQQMK